MNKTDTSLNKRKLYIIIAVVTIISIVFRLISYSGLNHSSILFVGIPALIALLIIQAMPTAKSVAGLTYQVITIFLLISAIAFGEGVVCILFAAPIFYGVAALIIAINKHKNKRLHSLFLLPIIIALLQPFGINTTPKTQSISVSKTYNRNLDFSALNQQPNFQNDMPTFFNIGFPQPINITGKGIQKGNQRHIQFLSQTKGIGTLSLQVDTISESDLIFKIIRDDTHIGHWLTWEKIHLTIKKENNQSTLTWSSEFTCDLGPQWYFEPLERFAVKLMNQHLINSYFSE